MILTTLYVGNSWACLPHVLNDERDFGDAGLEVQRCAKGRVLIVVDDEQAGERPHARERGRATLAWPE